MGAKTVVSGVVLIAAAIIVYFLFSSSEEDRIKEQFNRIAEAVSKDHGENQISAMAKIRQLKDGLAPKCEVDAPIYGLDQEMTCNDIEDFVFQERNRYGQIVLKFHRFSIRFSMENHAAVDVTAGFSGESTTGQRSEDYHVLTCHLAKTDDMWQLKQINVIEALEP